MGHLTLYHRKSSLNDDCFHFSSARKSNWVKGREGKTETLPEEFLMEKHSACKNVLWECVDFNVFLNGFSCESAQFLSDELPACLLLKPNNCLPGGLPESSS